MMSKILTETHTLSRGLMTTIPRRNYQVPKSLQRIFIRKPVVAAQKPRTTYANEQFVTYPKPTHKYMLALLIAAHNEELVIAKTIRSAINAGMKPEHIYVVDDNSGDRTSAIARSLLPRENVMRVRRSGKGLALTKAGRRFNLVARYRWIHIADADGAFAPDYFKVFRGSIRVKYAAATGYVRSLPGKNVSQYRVFEYTLGMEFHRRIQSTLNIIPVIPGPTSCFRADVFARVNFANKSITEDFDVTLQIHRQKLGKIQFIPGAVTYTQDPRTVKDFMKQITRWNRGVLQGASRHRIGRHMSLIDAYLSYQIFQNLLFFVNYFVWLPIVIAKSHSANIIASLFVYDVLVTLGISLLVSMKSRRWDMLSAFPIVYALRWVSLYVFLRAFVEVILMRKFRVTEGTWENGAGRRYALPVSV